MPNIVWMMISRAQKPMVPTVLGWLTERTLTEARILLRHSSMMMYEISDYLHFSEATAFGSYFKKHTGMTPLEYRENK